ncbi:MAG: hypothetical protein DRP54_07435 [Spirochaetes bacterium]|nr:MAG: hypothetical protein DRP54_07435 [Spirochaetota bacterium]
MEKNTILAIVAIFIILLVFQLIFLRPTAEKPQQVPQEEVAGQKVPQQEKAPLEKEESIPIPVPIEEAEKKVVSVETDYYSIKLSTEGASLISLKLKRYKDRNGEPIELVSLEEGDVKPFEIQFSRLRNVSKGDRTIYHVKRVNDLHYIFYTNFKDQKGNIYSLQKEYIFYKSDYVFDVKVSIKAINTEEIFLNNNGISYTMIWGPVLGPISVVKNRYNITTQGYYENGKFRKVMRGAAGCTLRKGESRYEEVSKVVEWVGMSNRYFFLGIIPDQKDYIYSFDQRTQNKFLLAVSHPYFKGKEFEDSFKVYAGPKDRKILKHYGHDFESVMSGKILKPLVIFLEWMIKVFYRVTKNYGLAIILMTITIKLILHPLTKKSFESMRRMSALQPKINELRERYRNNPQQLNKEITALYRKERVNPMGGCLPMLLQLPIFYALYTVLSSMIDLRNESFLWIKDLSLPDTVATIKTALPLLGYRLGGQGYTDINILPFIMTGTTLLQSKLTSGDQSAQQGKMMTYLFPIIFFFIFWNMPSGLVLYWTVQNILTIGQQYIIDIRLKKKMKVPVKPKGMPVKSKGVKRK